MQANHRIVRTLLVPWMLLVPGALDAYVYTNFYDGSSNITSMAISNMTNKVFLGQSRLYRVEDPNSAAAAKDFSADSPLFFLDIHGGLERRHQALGFMDLMVTLMADPPAKTWRMLGDSDQRNDSDYRAVDGDGILYDLIDTNYKANFLNTSYDSSLVKVVTTNLSSSSYMAKGGEYVVLRFAVPRWESSAYGVYLGRNIRLGSTPGQEASETGRSYQVLLHTPRLTNSLIACPVVSSPSVDGVWDSVYDPSTRVRGVSTRTLQLPRGVPITFSATNSFNTTGFPITNWEWNFGDGITATAAPSISRTFTNNGRFSLWLRVTAGGLQAATSALVTDTNGFNPGGPSLVIPDANPSALPLTFTVTDPPTAQVMGRIRPSPFVPGLNRALWVDFRLDREVFVNLGIFTLEGNLVRSLAAQKYPAGFWSIPWDGKDPTGLTVGEGIYYAVLETPVGREIRKVLVARIQ